MKWSLEVVVIPVSDDVRVVQLTPIGSGCSIVISKGLGDGMAPGSLKGVQLVVADIHAAHDELLANGVGVSDVVKLGENPSGEEYDNVGFLFFDDPDGSSWAVQQISSRG